MKGIPVNSGDAFFFSNSFNFILCNIKQIVVFNGAEYHRVSVSTNIANRESGLMRK